ncbi:MAG: Nif3-like dinuclear metal center hexameric protein [Syntrophothermus sp.]
MRCIEIFKYLETWAPQQIAWLKDNPGLQAGDPNAEVKNILLCLEVTEKVVLEALNKNCNLIFTHHPLIFQPLSKIDFNNHTSKILQSLIKNDINLYSAHTNLDFTKEGVSFKLAQKLDLTEIKFLRNLYSNQYKLSIFVPEKALEAVADAAFNSGAGVIGEYSKCSFRTEGIGTFFGNEHTNPSEGSKETFEKVNEVKLELIVDKWKLNKVLDDVNRVHPYEEIAYDVMPLENPNVNYGAGAIGNLKNELTEKEFLKYVLEKLNLENFRYCKGKKDKIKRVAVCGGSGSDMLNDSINNADAFITADVKYHAFHDAMGKILLMDAGHYETEIFSLEEVQKRLQDFIKDKNINIHKYSDSTNPIFYYKK